MRNNRFDFKKFERRWEDQKRELPTLVARTAENQFKENFRLGGFLGQYLEKWSPRKIADAGRALLVKTGRLKRSIRAIPGYNFHEIKIASDVPYAKYHNEGTGKLPQRRFLGASMALNFKIRAYLQKAMSKVFSN